MGGGRGGLEQAVRHPGGNPGAKTIVSLVNSHTNATSKRWHLWEMDLRFALNSTPGWGGLAWMAWTSASAFQHNLAHLKQGQPRA